MTEKVATGSVCRDPMTGKIPYEKVLEETEKRETPLA